MGSKTTQLNIETFFFFFIGHKIRICFFFFPKQGFETSWWFQQIGSSHQRAETSTKELLSPLICCVNKNNHMGVNPKIGDFSPKMDGENDGSKPY